MVGDEALAEGAEIGESARRKIKKANHLRVSLFIISSML
jgi:hypothetical protein